MWGYNQVFPEPKRVTVTEAALDTAAELVRKLPCTDIRCRGASPAGFRTCDRCVALAHIEGIARTPA